MKRLNLNTPIEEDFNPFESNVDFGQLATNLADIDNRSIRRKFKCAQDPINLAFKKIENSSLKSLAKDFVVEGFSDMISFITDICK